MGSMLLPQLAQGVNGGRPNGSILGLEQSAKAPAPGDQERQVCRQAGRPVSLQMGCNLFSTPLFPDGILRTDALRAPIIQLI